MADSIRDALMQAYSGAEKEASEPDTETPVAAAADEPQAAVPEPAKEVATKPTDAPQATDGQKPVATEISASQPASAPVATPAPASWKPNEKAYWDKLPPEARAAVARREQETQRALSTSAEARRFSQTFDQAITPFKPLLQHYGVQNPIEAIVPLLQTRAALEIGTPAQKAQLVANLVRQFSVDIEQLDQALVAAPQQQQAAPMQQAPAFNPRSVPEFAPLFGLVEQMQRAQEAKVEAAIAEVASQPHFEELREEMADLIEVAKARGRELSIKDAYSICLNTNGLAPAPAAAAPSVSDAAAILARSRRAAGSVAGGPKGTPDAKPLTLRDTIAAAMG